MAHENNLPVSGLPSPTHGYADQIDLRILWMYVWRGKYIILSVTILFACIGVAIALSLSNRYQSTVILAEVEREGGSSSLLAQYGGLAAMAGINLNAGSADKVAQAIALLTSWPFLEDWVERNDITAEIMAVKKWDEESNSLVYDQDVFNPQAREWLLDSRNGESLKPNSFDVYKTLSGMLNVSQDNKTGLVTVSIQYYSPHLSKQWIDDLVVTLNENYRQQDIQKAQKNIDFLEGKLAETSVAEFQTNLYSMIESQLKTLMLAEVSTEYLMETVVPSKTAQEKSRPRRSLIALLFFMLGAMLSTFIVLIRGFLASDV